ncbi:ly6/PLAUR domain-containing protein 1 [Perca flavescens]|uniref:ly6/PLAUR domain-containing protein 1 n=1 Tax=Perca flavescens TaxID=8167 RepID=UPI00106ECB81|nr:ly6/PLAUR domain-containing protein 1-like [Perca flavescens]
MPGCPPLCVCASDPANLRLSWSCCSQAASRRCVPAPRPQTRLTPASHGSSPGLSQRTMRLFTVSTLLLFFSSSGLALQIQCYQCEEMTHDCSTPEFIVNCTVNVQDMCQKEVLVKDDGIHYRKSCASSGACLIASSGYQQFCTGKLNSVCITCCNTPLCNGPRQKKRPQPSAAIALTTPQLLVVSLYILGLLSSTLC